MIWFQHVAKGGARLMMLKNIFGEGGRLDKVEKIIGVGATK